MCARPPDGRSSATGAREILTLFRRTLDPKIAILACIADENFNEDCVVKISPACLHDLQQVAMTMFFGP